MVKLAGQEKELAERRNEHFLQLFNQATLPFYWGRFEPQRGQPKHSASSIRHAGIKRKAAS